MQCGYWISGEVKIRLAVAKNDAGLFNEHFCVSSEETERSYDMISPLAGECEVYNWLRGYEIDKSDERHVFVIETLGNTTNESTDNSRRFIGYIDVWEASSRFGVFKTGIKLTDGNTGKGYASSAFRRILDYYFNELRYEKCGVYIYEFNNASLRFHEKFGFVEEGRHRRECFTRGKHYDALYYGLLRDEFNVMGMRTG